LIASRAVAKGVFNEMFHASHSLLEIAGYVLIGSVFISQAVATLSPDRFQFHASKLRDKRIPAPAFVLGCGLAMMLSGGLMVMLDVYPRVGASMLIFFTVVATFLYQSFWTFKDPARRREKRSSFFNNLAILGGLLLIVSQSAA
jgi:uncharacterized membrane protein YphA (DoxX/SURF4 family)